MNPQEENQKIRELEETIRKKDEYIQHLEKFSNAYNGLSELFSRELMEADKLFKAQEIIRNMMEEERKSADQTILAHEHIEELAVMEKKAAEEMLKAQCIVEDLSVNELMHKDKTLRKILEINKNISAITEPAKLFQNILESLIDSIEANRGILYIREDGNMIPKAYQNIDAESLDKELPSISRELMESAEKGMKSLIKVNEKVQYQGKTVNISMICAPLIYENNLLGILYADIISDFDNFKEHDLNVAEIFSSLAAISLNNTLSYNKISLQNDNLLKLVNLKNNFISHLSNELNEPLNDIVGRLHAIHPNESAEFETATKSLHAIEHDLQKLQKTVEKVLTIINLEDEVSDLFTESINFKEIIANIIQNHHSEMSEKGIKTVVNLPEVFENYKANELMVNIVLDEIISNAVYYNKQNGMITVNGGIKDHYLFIEVEDTGAGIREEDLAKIFQQFYRTKESAEMNKYGAGLGLFMVKKTIRFYGGDVSVESVLGKGSKFTVKFLIH